MKKNFSDYIVALSVLACSLVLLIALALSLGGVRPRAAPLSLPDAWRPLIRN